MKEKTKSILKNHFSATHIAYMAFFTALAFVVTFLEFPIFPATPYLKLDFANAFFMIEGFIFGPVEAIVSIAIKELLCFTKTTSGGAGQLANFLTSTAYIILPSIAYRFKKGKWWVGVYLVCACILQIAVSLPANRFLTFPAYMGDGAADVFNGVWQFVLAFNAVKSVVVSVVVLIIYKPLSRVIKMTAERLSRRKTQSEKKKSKSKKEKIQVEKEKNPSKQEEKLDEERKTRTIK